LKQAATAALARLDGKTGAITLAAFHHAGVKFDFSNAKF
jgi:hypothetical protein